MCGHMLARRHSLNPVGSNPPYVSLVPQVAFMPFRSLVASFAKPAPTAAECQHLPITSCGYRKPTPKSRAAPTPPLAPPWTPPTPLPTKGLATEGFPDVRESQPERSGQLVVSSLWIQRSHRLKPEEMTGWVVAQILQEFEREPTYTAVCATKSFQVRTHEARLDPALVPASGPRKRIASLRDVDPESLDLLHEKAPRLKIAAIQRSLPAYRSGLRCWAAFCDAIGRKQHLPVKASTVTQFSAMFANTMTLKQYLKHLRWAHRFLDLPITWETPSLTQILRGLSAGDVVPRQKIALPTKVVMKMVKVALDRDAMDVATVMVLSRAFMLRVPSEALPLEWAGSHSRIEVNKDMATITLARRKNSRGQVTLTRRCTCTTGPPVLCAVHWLLRLRTSGNTVGRVVSVSRTPFAAEVKCLAQAVGFPNAALVGTHAFRCGMAQDLMGHGGTLATLMQAGGWKSSAFQAYLRTSQLQDAAVSSLVINVSDSDEEL